MVTRLELVSSILHLRCLLDIQGQCHKDIWLWKGCLLTFFPVRSLWFSMTPQGGIPTVQIFLKDLEEWAFRAFPTCLETPMNDQYRSQILTHPNQCKIVVQKETHRQVYPKGHSEGRVPGTATLVSDVSASSIPSSHLFFLSLTSGPQSPFGQLLLRGSVLILLFFEQNLLHIIFSQWAQPWSQECSEYFDL